MFKASSNITYVILCWRQYLEPHIEALPVHKLAIRRGVSPPSVAQ